MRTTKSHRAIMKARDLAKRQSCSSGVYAGAHAGTRPGPIFPGVMVEMYQMSQMSKCQQRS